MALISWLFGSPSLSALGQGRIPMAPSTALLFILYGAGAIAITFQPLTQSLKRAFVVLGSAGGIAALVLFFCRQPEFIPKLKGLAYR
jgi:hypothetical protein